MIEICCSSLFQFLFFSFLVVIEPILVLLGAQIKENKGGELAVAPPEPLHPPTQSSTGSAEYDGRSISW